MSWGAWSSRLNVQSIVSQGLEQVSKLKEDVEKQFDQVVASSSTQPPGSRSRTTAAQETAAIAVNEELLKNIESLPPPLPPPPPRSVDGKSSSAALLASLGIAQPPSSGAAGSIPSDPPASAPSSAPSTATAADFFGSYLADGSTKTTATPPTSGRGTAASLFADASAPSAPVSTPEPAAEDQGGDDDDDDNDNVVLEQVSSVEDDAEDTENGAVQDTAATEQDEATTADEGDEDTEHQHAIEKEDEHEASTPDGVDHSAPCDDEDANIIDQDEQASSPEAESEASLQDPRVHALEEQLRQREAQLLSTSAVIQELHDELDKTCQREVAAVERNRFLTEQLELLRLELRRVASHQPAQHADVEALQQAVADKDAKLQALLDEGQALSVKQAQLEQRLRQLRRERNDEEQRRLELQASSDALTLQSQELAAKLKDSEQERKRLAQELLSAQQASDAATQQLRSLQASTEAAKEREASLSAALDAATKETAALADELALLRDTSDAHATLSAEKREMEATLAFLQQRASDVAAEAQRREDAARLEVLDLKRKWQDALLRVEALGQGVAEATQPLLRQVHALQEEQRLRQEAWAATEATLRQRLQDASAQRQATDRARLADEQQLHQVTEQRDELLAEVQRSRVELGRERERVEAALAKERVARAQCDALQLERDELMGKLQERHALLARAESARRVEGEDGELAAMAATVEELRRSEATLRHDLAWHQKELQRVKAAASSPRLTALPHRRSFDESGSSSSSDGPASILQRSLEASTSVELGGGSVLGHSQLQQRLRLKEGENRLLRAQVEAVEAKHQQTTDEIVRLSTRNALLESSAAQFEATRQALEQLQQKQHVLLELFGEKEEQVEELQAEVAELKAFYRKQLDTLASQRQ